ncbi:B3/4 domain-containing protein [Alkalihalobacillus pseudalcaliphilus]|uniref:B3/B4 domain-containing protein n=1 Tax=Alkalihalobacillus pseudalcaliphilus TaxID=79884 RepID=UPI00064DB860|nr:phenylalanine--tRNA ligase beta subunit-related protein [Alkalihalobacillus pseudalcaliphilus]KMK75630.1 tRNA synthetase subunit beta [Alkalihalobacillus pseudalcaliphilus]
MTCFIVTPDIFLKLPQFKIGIIQYKQITVTPSPQMFKGRFQLFQESLHIEFADKPITEITGIQSFRQVFKEIGFSPSKYRPSSESLLRRIKKGNYLKPIDSAVDLTNFFSIKYEIPIGIYDSDHLSGNLQIRIGANDEMYQSLHGREQWMNGILLSADEQGPFGSPIVDSTRTRATENTKNAVQIFYLQPEMSKQESNQLLEAAANMFTQLNGGSSHISLLSIENPEA